MFCRSKEKGVIVPVYSADKAGERPETVTAMTLERAWLNDDALLSFQIDPIEEWSLPLWDETSLSSYVSFPV